MNEDENNELAIATLALSRKYNGKKLNEEVRYGIASTKLEQYRSGKGAEDTWLSGPNSPQNSWNMVDIEYPDIVKTLSDRMSDAVAEISKGLKGCCLVHNTVLIISNRPPKAGDWVYDPHLGLIKPFPPP